VLAAYHVWTCASSPDFLATVLKNSSRQVEQSAFLDELEDIMGSHHRQAAESRLSEIKEFLRTTFVAMPKTAHGRLSTTSARYAVHRLFVQRHGWHVKGVAPGGESWAPNSSALGLGNRLPPRLRDLLEERFGSEDFTLDELTLLVATIEALIHSEAIGRLHATYHVLDKDPEASLGEEEAIDIIYSCMTTYLAGYNISELSHEQVSTTRRAVEEDYPYWKHTKALIHESQQSASPDLKEYSFSDVERILEIVSASMGRRVDEGNCQDIEDRLVAIEETPGTGRVRLSDFYSSHLNNGNWQFQERPEYLRQLGVLDESDPSLPRIIIPNYLIMQANCLNVSTYYDLCCIDLCEDLLDKIEDDIKGPQAAPSDIIRIVTSMDSAYVSAGRTLSRALVKKLNEVAEYHGGQVPIHGRLFSQWMHFAYPNECPYPHLFGTTKLLTDTEWFAETGMRSWATQPEMQAWINSTQRHVGPITCDDWEEGMCMWAAEEELVDAVSWQVLAPVRSLWPSVRAPLRACAFLAMLVSSIMGMRGIMQQAMCSIRDVRGHVKSVSQDDSRKKKGEVISV